VCGDFEADAAKRLIGKYFGDLPRGPHVPPIPGRTRIEPIIGEEVRAVVTQDVSLPRVYVAYRVPPFGDDEFLTALVTSYIMTYGKASLLYRTLVRERQAVQDVVCYAFPVVVGAAMLVVWATARPGRTATETETALHEEIDRLRAIDDADVERAVNLLETDRLNELQRVDERADQLSMYTQLFDEPERINTEVDRIRAVTPQRVRDFAGRYLGAANRVVLQYVPPAVGA
jgi:predicted Zn-dependent peptidase